jgi:hypothetical protein
MLILLPTYFTITSGDVTTMLGVASDLIGDFLPIILVFIGLTISFAIWEHFKGK